MYVVSQIERERNIERERERERERRRRKRMCVFGGERGRYR